MANNSLAMQDSFFTEMMLQLDTKTAQQALMQQELQNIKFQLEQASKTLVLKDQIIGSLEQDLEHMIEQFTKIQRNHHADGVVA